MEQLKKRGFHLASRYALCGKVEENLNHLLFHCPLVWDLWAGLISIPTFLGSAHTPLRTYYPAGAGSLLGRGLESFGWQPSSVLSRLFGRRGIELSLKMLFFHSLD